MTSKGSAWFNAMKSWSLWVLAIAVTLASAVYQRMTGPSYPVRGERDLTGEIVRYKLIRTFDGSGDAPVRVAAPSGTEGTLAWRRHKSSDRWTYIAMKPEGAELVGSLPHQPPAGKLEYRVILQRLGERVWLTGPPVVIRFRGHVPLAVLVLHVIAMFAGMLCSNRAGLEAMLAPKPDYRKLAAWTLGLLTVGGMILGPVVQKYAFGEFWTGWPFGTDLTDNKTAGAWILWIAAYFAVRQGWKRAGWVVLAAAAVTLAVYLVPHSMFGSELKYN